MWRKLDPAKLAPLLIVAVGLLAYGNSFSGPFFFDDEESIPDNSHIRRLWPPWEPLRAPPNTTVAGRPIVGLSLAINYALGGLHVWGYHAFNLAIHLLAALTLYGIVRRTLSGGRLGGRYGAHANGLALAIALLWLAHPLQTECVDYTIQRTESLMGLFLLLTLYCVLRGAESLQQRRWYGAAVICCALGMGCKEVMVCAPLVVLLYDRLFLTGSQMEIGRRRRALYAGLAGTWLILVALVVNTPRTTTGFGFESLSLWDYLKTESGVIVHYLRLCLWPQPLVIDYFDWPIAQSLVEVLPAGIAVVTLLAATGWATYRRSPWGMLGGWFFLILAPTSSILPSFGEVAAERRMYLPLAAVVTLVVICGHSVLAAGSQRCGRKQPRWWGPALVAALALDLCALTVQRNEDYRSNSSIWNDAVVKRPKNARARNNLGNTLTELGRNKEAVFHLKEAIRFEPSSSVAHYNLAKIYYNLAKAHYNLANAFVQQGKRTEALAEYTEALRLDPNYAKAHFNLGLLLAKEGKWEAAILHYTEALRINPYMEQAHNSLGLALVKQGKPDQALSHYAEALRLNPDYAQAHNNLGIVLARQGKLNEAIAHYLTALRLNPADATVHNNLGVALVRFGRLDEAITHFSEAIRLQPDYAEPKKNLHLVQELRRQETNISPR